MEKVREWYNDQLEKCSSTVEEIPFSQLDEWYFDEVSRNIQHVSGKFFTVTGVRFTCDSLEISKQWEQPIIDQPEIGVLGILSKKSAGQRKFLMQAKMEPGNINVIQLSPTVQATMSNYTRVHRGKKTDYLEYFLNTTESKVLVDSLQTEQGGRFYQKRNRNIMVEVDKHVELKENYCWISEREIKALLKEDNLVNMNSRSVFSCYLSSGGGEHSNSVNSTMKILNWITQEKIKYRTEVKKIPLKDVSNWKIEENEIRNLANKYFSVVAVRVRSGNREVMEWTQPIIKETHPGFVGCIIKKFNGIDHYLIQAKNEPGNIDTIYIGPTIQCSHDNLDKSLNYMPLFMKAKPERIRFDTILSEEGGRFYHYQNRYMAIEVDDEIELTEKHFWISYPQVLEFIRYSLLDIEARTIIASVNMGKEV